MKNIYIQPSNEIFSKEGLFNRPDIGHDLFCWQELKRRFYELGYELTTADDNPINECSWILFVDTASLDSLEFRELGVKTWIKTKLGRKTNFWATRPLYKEVRGKNFENKVLFLWEGKAVNPVNYNKNIWDNFKYIFTWNDDLVDNKKFLKFHLPISDFTPIDAIIPFNKKKLLVNITINKYSSYKNELYSARRKSIDYFYENFPNNFDLYGLRWNAPITRMEKIFPFLVKKYKNYKGHTDNKLKTLSNYKFALCYENNGDANGYITEKIFDAFRGKTVPIYLGAPNIEKYVDKESFIDRRKFKNNKELADFIIKMSENEYNRYLEAADRYMRSEKYAKFLGQNFCNTIIDALNIKSLEM